MRLLLGKLEYYAMNSALALFLLLCVISAVDNKIRIVMATRNALLLLMGFAGLFLAGELGNLRKGRLALRKKRMVFVAEYLLIAFSLVMLFFGMSEFGLLTALSRWD